MTEKLQKILAHAGLGSRRKMEEWIAAGRVTVDGHVAKLGDRATEYAKIYVDGKLIQLCDEKTRVLLYHKPVGEICTHDDPEERPTIFAQFPPLTHGKWISVGRLDVQTSGLILVTNDGDLAQKLAHPSFGLVREYRVRVMANLDNNQLRALTNGVRLEDGTAKFDEIVHLWGTGANHWYQVTLQEGRNRIVRRLFESQRVKINRLVRVGYGPIALPADLKPGRFVELSVDEVL